jgi:hypothetical protein
MSSFDLSLAQFLACGESHRWRKMKQTETAWPHDSTLNHEAMPG